MCLCERECVCVFLSGCPSGDDMTSLSVSLNRLFHNENRLASRALSLM